MEENSARRQNAGGVLSLVIVLSFYVSLQASGGFLHANIYPINQCVEPEQHGPVSI